MRFKLKSVTPQWLRCLRGNHIPHISKTIPGVGAWETVWVIKCKACGAFLRHEPVDREATR